LTLAPGTPRLDGIAETGGVMNARYGAPLALFVMGALASPACAGPSVYVDRPDDPEAVQVAGIGDGKADDTDAIQAAIDKVAKPFRGGLVFLPSGRYRITRTIVLPPAVRIVGIGPTRPVILLADNTPGFSQGLSEMIVFSGGDQYQVGKIPVPLPNIVPRDKQVRDANSGTFYTTISNVDIEIGKGNPAAIGVRMHIAQHGFLRHMDFRTGSGFAGAYMVGNEAEDLHFIGGRYGIVTEKTSPAWQFTLIDSLFEGQRDAAIREHEPQLTLLNVTFRNVPVGVEIDEGYGDWLYGKDVRFENVSKAGVIISNEASVYTQVSFDNALLDKTPVFASFRESGKTLGQKGAYKVAEFTHGLTLPAIGEMGKFETRYKAETLARMPAPRTRAIRALPPTSAWINVRSLGVKGDAKTDDTAALQAAIDAHPVLYFPTGFYLVTDTLKLRPDSQLIGLHPGLTTITLPDNAPKFAGIGSFKAVIEAPKGGSNVLASLGIFTGRINPRAGNILWKAGEDSLIDDVKIQGGGGTTNYDGKGLDIHSRPGGDPTLNNHWDETRPSIWVTDGGGGTFSTIWSPNTFAQNGFYVSDTSTPGRVYQTSVEHHIRNEITLDNVQNWEFLAPQTEQEVGDGVDAFSLEIRNSKNLLFANYHGYRVTRTIKAAPVAVRIYNSSGIRFRNVHVNSESGYASCDDQGCGTYLRASKYPYSNSIRDMTHQIDVRERQFAVLDVVENPAKPVRSGPMPKKLEDGFWSISGGAVDASGKLYFVEHRFNRIYSYSAAEGLNIVQDAPIDPVNIGVDKSGNLLVLSMLGPHASVYSVPPKVGEGKIALIEPTPVQARPGAKVLYPSNLWNNGEFKDQYDPATDKFGTLAELFARDVALPKAQEYVSPDGSLVLPAFRTWQQGPNTHQGWRWSDTLDTYGFVSASVGERITLTNGSENKTYSAVLGQGGTLTGLKVVADRGGESAAVGPDGKVYVANGQIFVYGADGKEAERIDVPDRPIQLLFGGPEKRTLFIFTHHALYALER
jgi:hypothetical protein